MKVSYIMYEKFHFTVANLPNLKLASYATEDIHYSLTVIVAVFSCLFDVPNLRFCLKMVDVINTSKL
jgi:hypothetical protein